MTTPTSRARIRINNNERRLSLSPSSEMVLIPILVWLVWASFMTKATTSDAELINFSDDENTVLTNSRRHRLLRRHNGEIRFTKDRDTIFEPEVENQEQRFLQAYTNETTNYEDGPAVNQDRVVDFEYCFGALQRADTNDDGRLERSEYLPFVQDFGQNTECLGDLLSLPVMPIELTACWNQLSCECLTRGGAPDCCSEENAHLPLSGVNAVYPAPSGQTKPQPPNEVYIQEEQGFLNRTCLRTDQCIISYCGYPPPPLPPVIPPPPVVPPVIPDPIPSEASEPNWLWLLLLLLLLLCCCCRRRWVLCPAGKVDEEENAEQAPPGDPMVMRSLPVDNDDEFALPRSVENVVDDFEGDYNDPDANRMAMKSTAGSEIGEGGGVRYYRIVKEPEYEEDPVPPEPKVIDQYDKGLPPSDDMKLKHVEKTPPPPPEEDPYALEHYEPDGGVVEHERTGEWSYEADGGYTPEERAEKEKSEWNRPGYERAAVAAVAVSDDRRDRSLDRYGGGAIFDHLDETVESVKKGGGGKNLEWVFSKTLNTLDENEDDLRSEASASKTSL